MQQEAAVMFLLEPVGGAVAWREEANNHLFGNFQMFLSKVHGLLMIPQGGVGIS